VYPRRPAPCTPDKPIEHIDHLAVAAARDIRRGGAMIVTEEAK